MKIKKLCSLCILGKIKSVFGDKPKIETCPACKGKFYVD